MTAPLSGMRANGELELITPRAFLPLLKPVRFKGARGGRGSAKCLGIGTLVVMSDGTRRPVEDIRPDDTVMGPDGKPRLVLDTTCGTGELYRVDQKGGESYVVNADHILSLKRAANSFGRNGKTHRYPSYGPIASIRASEFGGQSARWKANYRGYRCGVIEFPIKELPIPPYVFGAWLGDGTEGRAELTSMDDEVIAAFLSWGQSVGCICDRRPSKSRANGYILIVSRGKGSNNRGQRNSLGRNPAKEALKQLGVLANKHVPIAYQTCSLIQRLEFLAGFIDTDGSFKGNCYTISQKRERVIREVKYVADLCGFRTDLRPMFMNINGEPRRYWRLTISGAVERIPCRVPRKVGTGATPNKDWLCGTISVTPIGVGEYAGLSIDGDHLFLLGDCTVTHNSHFVAERMIADCIQDHHRIACLREYQSSIKDSVKQLLEDKIRQFGHERKFVITDTEIRGPNESLCVFKGLHSGVGGTAFGLQSLEGFTRAWVEEAQTTSERSLIILEPTFRSKPGVLTKPELWFSWNPIRPDDPIEQFFNENEDDPDFACVSLTYADNPWFEESGLRGSMERDRKRDSAKYAHVWLGQYLLRSEAQVFQDWEVKNFETPDDVRFYYGADWGFSNDPTVLVRMWIDGNDLYIDHEAYQIGCKLEATPTLFLKVPGSRGEGRRPKPRIRADSARPETIDYMKDRGFNMVPSIKGKNSVDDGIEFLKNFHIIIHERCVHTIDEFAKYSWKVDPKTDEVLPVLVDKDNHVVDSVRYALEQVRHTSNPVILSNRALDKVRQASTRDRFGLQGRDRFARAR